MTFLRNIEKKIFVKIRRFSETENVAEVQANIKTTDYYSTLILNVAEMFYLYCRTLRESNNIRLQISKNMQIKL